MHVDGLPVSSSPFSVNVLPGPPRGANTTASGSALVVATAGENSSFFIHARDREANPTEKVPGAESDGYVMDASYNARMWSVDSGASSSFIVSLMRADGNRSGSEDPSVNSTAIYAEVEALGEREGVKA